MIIKDLIKGSIDDSIETFEISTKLFYMKGLHNWLSASHYEDSWALYILHPFIKDQLSNSYIEWEDQESLIQFGNSSHLAYKSQVSGLGKGMSSSSDFILT